MAQTSSSPLPPASAEYETAMHGGAGKLPQIHKWTMFRSSQNETHLDFGKTGLISKPDAKQAILLDHVKREARIVPAPAPPHAPAPAGNVPHAPAPPPSPSSLLHVKDLGKQTIEGHQAEGKLYTFQPPKAPPAPGAKRLPNPKAPKPGALPQPPHQQVQTLEVWTHTTLKVPLVTKAAGIPGLQGSVCKDAKAGEPHASLFEIPPGYKLVEPKPPAVPGPARTSFQRRR